jgi:outer membrane protein OmpA-like peptidoglycan-associated protein
MDDYREKKSRRRWTKVLRDLLILIVAVAVAGGLGWLIGRGDAEAVRPVTTQLRKTQNDLRNLRTERGKLLQELQVAREGGPAPKETDTERLLARKEAEWKRKFNQVRIEAEVSKVKRVAELERKIRQLQIDERMKGQAGEGDDSRVAENIAPGLTPRARLVCEKILQWEGLPEGELEAAREGLARELGARALVRIEFGKGSALVRDDAQDVIRVALTDTEEYSLLLAVGFADIGGDKELNRELGTLRAQNAADAMRARTQRGQLVESVYLGETERFGPREENRTVEIWELRR